MSAPKSVLITGASSGIGEFLAYELARRGHRLILAARREEVLKEIAARCLKLGAAGAEVCVLDLLDPANVQAAGERLIAAPSPRVLVNNAGVAQFGLLTELATETIDRELTINYTAPVHLTRAVLPSMLRDHAGQIVNVLSVAAQSAFSGGSIYCSTKAGLLQFGRALSEEVRKQGVRVTNVLPGSVNTPLWDLLPSSPPRDQMMTAEDVALATAEAIDAPLTVNVDELKLMPLRGFL